MTVSLAASARGSGGKASVRHSRSDAAANGPMTRSGFSSGAGCQARSSPQASQ